MRPVTAKQRIAARYIPSNALPIEETGLGVVYVYPAAGKYGAIAYLPKAMKRSWHYTFKTDAALDQYIANWFDGLRQHQAMIQKHKEIRSKPHTFKIGDVVTNSWGYDQTNVDWYRVVKTTARFIWLQPIAGQTEAAEGYSSMAGLSSPAIDTSSENPADWGFAAGSGKITQHAATGDNCTMRHGCGSKWDGKPKYESWYA